LEGLIIILVVAVVSAVLQNLLDQHLVILILFLLNDLILGEALLQNDVDLCFVLYVALPECFLQF
jgi:hypothetical protein